MAFVASKVRTILEHFEKWSLISTRADIGQLVIRVNEYDKYQDKPAADFNPRFKPATNPALKSVEANNTNTFEEQVTESQPSNQPTEQPDPNPNNKNIKNNKEYWWAGEVIKLNEGDYKAWYRRYEGTDDQFMDWLKGRDGWLAASHSYP